MDPLATAMSNADVNLLIPVENNGNNAATNSTNSTAQSQDKKKKRATSASNRLTIQDKIDIIRLLDSGMDRKSIQEKFGIKSYQIKDTLKMKDRLLAYHESGQNLDKSAIRYGSYPLIEDEVGKWMREMKRRGAQLDGKAIKAKAMQIALINGINDFKASYCWIAKVKKRQLNCKLRKNDKSSKRLSIQEKIEVINLLTSGTEKKAVQQMFGIKSYHIKDILKMKDKLLAYRATGNNLDKSSIRFESFPTIDAEVGRWLRDMSHQGITVDGKTIKDKAIQVAKSQGIENFKASYCWIAKMRKRQLSSSNTRSGPSTSATASSSATSSRSLSSLHSSTQSGSHSSHNQSHTHSHSHQHSHSHSNHNQNSVWATHSKEPQDFLLLQTPLQQQASIQHGNNGVVRSRI